MLWEMLLGSGGGLEGGHYWIYTAGCILKMRFRTGLLYVMKDALRFLSIANFRVHTFSSRQSYRPSRMLYERFDSDSA